jgi:hypothetical protein
VLVTFKFNAGYDGAEEEAAVIAVGVVSGLVMLQFRLTGQLLAPEAMTQEGAEEVRVPDIGGGGETTTCMVSVAVPPSLSVTVRRKT